MGVQGLWTLLEPCGRRINIEAISNKKLAVGGWCHAHACTLLEQRACIHRPHALAWGACPCVMPRALCAPHADASIWLFQFMKAMRNERGEMVKNAHLRGFFSRICRCGGLLCSQLAALRSHLFNIFYQHNTTQHSTSQHSSAQHSTAQLS